MGADLLGLGMKLQFDPFELDTDRAELRTVSGPVKLEPKVFRLLCLLVENNERVIGKDEMIAVVWAGRFISDAAVSTALKAVRKALGDDGERQEFIRTIRGVGHRFVAPVRIRPTDINVVVQVSEAERSVAMDGRGVRPTVAVLPFGRTGLPDAFASLGDAIPADIISSLARLRWLRVIAPLKCPNRCSASEVGVPAAVATATLSPCATRRAVAVSSPDRAICHDN